MSNLSNKALQVAITQLGVEEIPRGSNWGAPVKGYLNRVGLNFPASWCMAFVYWCFDEASKQLAIKNPTVKTAGCLAHWNSPNAVSKRVQTPQAGDIFIMDFGGGLGHTGIVEKVDADGTLHTIEGNTNDTGSREGYEVCRRVRKKSQMKGFLRY